MISKYLKCLAILLVLIKTNAAAEGKVVDMQKLAEDILGARMEDLRKEIQRFTDEIARLRELNKSANSKIEMLLMLLCKRSCECGEPRKDIVIRQLPKNCAEAVRNNGGDEGVYKLSMPTSEFLDMKPFYAYCSYDGSTIIQQRSDGLVDFNRGWEQYKRGFGNLNREYFIGLDKLHALTREPQQLVLELVEMHPYNRRILHATYDAFAVGDASSKYALEVLGECAGVACISLENNLKGVKFTTKDNNNDESGGENCALHQMSAWWYLGCSSSTLNGPYGKDNGTEGIAWNGMRLMTTQMALKPAQGKRIT